MKHLKTFQIFESSGDIYGLTPEQKKIIDGCLVNVEYSVITDASEMHEWVVENALGDVTDEYLDSEEFINFTRERVENSEEYRKNIESSEKDPDEILGEMTDKAVEDQTYWDGFLEETGYETEAFELWASKVHYTGGEPDRAGDLEYEGDLETTFYVNRSRSKINNLPVVSFEGSISFRGFSGSFLPFEIDTVDSPDLSDLLDLFPFQELEITSPVGECAFVSTNLIALDRGPRVSEAGYYIRGNDRLISLESIDGFAEIENDNFLDTETLESSKDLAPESEESVDYYTSLLSHPKFPEFDKEQIEFTVKRIGYGSLQQMIDDDPAKMAILLKSNWGKMKSNPAFSGIKFPENYSKEVDLLGDLADVGL